MGASTEKALQAPVVRKVDNAIHWIAQLDVVILILWIAIYPVDSAIQLSNNRGLVVSFPTLQYRYTVYRVSQKFVPLLYSLYFSAIGLGKQIISIKVVSFNLIHFFILFQPSFDSNI